MNTWMTALKVAMIGVSAVFLGLLMLAGGIKIMSFCCKLVARKEKTESSHESEM
jgi:Na+-transporting methylmalonyl-CoA/oxaloacetate decarboxylase gamma subunit